MQIPVKTRLKLENINYTFKKHILSNKSLKTKGNEFFLSFVNFSKTTVWGAYIQSEFSMRLICSSLYLKNVIIVICEELLSFIIYIHIEPINKNVISIKFRHLMIEILYFLYEVLMIKKIGHHWDLNLTKKNLFDN